MKVENISGRVLIIKLILTLCSLWSYFTIYRHRQENLTWNSWNMTMLYSNLIYNIYRQNYCIYITLFEPIYLIILITWSWILYCSYCYILLCFSKYNILSNIHLFGKMVFFWGLAQLSWTEGNGDRILNINWGCCDSWSAP